MRKYTFGKNFERMPENGINPKKTAAEKAVTFVEDGMIVGLGTGSTAYWAIQSIGEKVKQGVKIKAIATSGNSEKLAHELGIRIITFAQTSQIDLTIDGADEVDDTLNLIKGGGGALLREKIVGAATEKYIIIADENKVVNPLGKFPLPVEVVPFGWEMTMHHLKKLQCVPVVRAVNGQPFITDNGNMVLDCPFGAITDPTTLHEQINAIPGVVENGLFLGMATMVGVGHVNGEVTVLNKA